MEKMAISLRGKQIIIEMTEPEQEDPRRGILQDLRGKEFSNKHKLYMVYTLLEQIGLTNIDLNRFKPFFNLFDMSSSFIIHLHRAITEKWDPFRVYIGKMFLEFPTLWANYYPTYFGCYKDMSGMIDSKRSQFRSRVGVDQELENFNEMENCFNKLEEYLLLPFEQVSLLKLLK